MPRKAGPAAWILLAASGAACGGGAAERAAAPMRYDSAAITIIRHPALAAYRPEVWTPQYLMQIGEVDGPPERIFGEVGSGAILANGELAILDRHAAEIRIFTREGGFIRRAGRQGRGPGELSGDGTLAVLPLPGGGFAVPDIVNQSVTVFGRNGEVEAIHPFPDGIAGPLEWRVLSGDTMVVRTTDHEREIFIARTLDGSWQDTLATMPRIRQGPTVQEPRAPVPRDHRVWTMRDGRALVTARMSRPELTVVQGRERTRLSWQSDAKHLSTRDADHLLGVVVRRLGGEPARGVPPRVRELVVIAQVAPALADIRTGPGGTFMVQRLRPFTEMDRRVLSVFRAEGHGGRLWDLFSASGTYLGILDFGANVEILQIAGDTILGMREGEFGEAHIFLARFPVLPAADVRPAPRVGRTAAAAFE